MLFGRFLRRKSPHGGPLARWVGYAKFSRMTKRSLGLLLTVLSCAVGNLWAVTPAQPGFLEGDLSIQSERGVDLADKPSATPSQTSSKDFRLVVLSKDHRTEIAEVSVDDHGHYRMPLPPGDYVLDIKRVGRKRVLATSHSFTITSQQTARVNMEIIPAGPPPM